MQRHVTVLAILLCIIIINTIIIILLGAKVDLPHTLSFYTAKLNSSIIIFAGWFCYLSLCVFTEERGEDTGGGWLLVGAEGVMVFNNFDINGKFTGTFKDKKESMKAL